jgi:MFS family permease
MISSSYSLAACVTSLVVSTFAFQIGRRGTVILGCVAAVIGSVIQSASYSVAQLIVGRICTVRPPDYRNEKREKLTSFRDLRLDAFRGRFR